MNHTAQDIYLGLFGNLIMEYRSFYITDRPYANTPFTLVQHTEKGPRIYEHTDSMTLPEMLDTIDVILDEIYHYEDRPEMPRWRVTEAKEVAKQSTQAGDLPQRHRGGAGIPGDRIPQARSVRNHAQGGRLCLPRGQHDLVRTHPRGGMILTSTTEHRPTQDETARYNRLAMECTHHRPALATETIHRSAYDEKHGINVVGLMTTRKCELCGATITHHLLD